MYSLFSACVQSFMCRASAVDTQHHMKEVKFSTHAKNTVGKLGCHVILGLIICSHYWFISSSDMHKLYAKDLEN